MATIEERVDDLEKQLTASKTAFKVSVWWAGILTLFIVGLLGYSTFWDIPNRVHIAMQGAPVVMAAEHAAQHEKNAKEAMDRIHTLEKELGTAETLRSQLKELDSWRESRIRVFLYADPDYKGEYWQFSEMLDSTKAGSDSLIESKNFETVKGKRTERAADDNVSSMKVIIDREKPKTSSAK